MGIKWHLGVLRLGAPAFPSDTGTRLASRAVFSRNSSGHPSVASAFASLEPRNVRAKKQKNNQTRRGISSNRPCGLPLCYSQLWMPTKLNGDKMAPGCFAAGRSCLSVGHWHKAGLAGGFQQEFKRTSISCISFRQLGAKKRTCKKTKKTTKHAGESPRTDRAVFLSATANSGCQRN